MSNNLLSIGVSAKERIFETIQDHILLSVLFKFLNFVKSVLSTRKP